VGARSTDTAVATRMVVGTVVYGDDIARYGHASPVGSQTHRVFQPGLRSSPGLTNPKGGNHVKLRSRVAAFAAAAGLAAGLLIVGGGGVAHAQVNTLFECDHVGGSAGVKPGLSNVALSNTAVSVKGPLQAAIVPVPFKPVVTTRDCTGILATAGDGGGGTPDDVGNLTKIAGKLIGSGTCWLTDDPPPPPNAIPDPLAPLTGKLSFTWTTTTPISLFTKPYVTDSYIRIGGGADPNIPDELVIKAGIVTKGPGVGGDPYGSFIFAPYDAKTKADYDNNPATAVTVRPDQSQLNGAGDLVAGVGSLLIGLDCISGLTTLATAFFATDGTNLTFQPFNSELGVSLPVPEP